VPKGGCKMERFEELSQALRKKADAHTEHTEVSKDVIAIIEPMYVEMKKIYESCKAMEDTRIRIFIDGKISEFKFQLSKIAKNRGDIQVEELERILAEMKDKVQEQKRKEEREKIAGIDLHTKKILEKIIQELEISLNDIKETGTRILKNKRTNTIQMDIINRKAKYLIEELIDKAKIKVSTILTKDDTELVNALLQEYDAYVQRTNMTGHQKFAQSYRASEEVVKRTASVAEKLGRQNVGNKGARVQVGQYSL